MARKFFYIIFLSGLCNVSLFSQGVVNNYPVQFSQIEFSKTSINPALICLRSPLEFIIGTQQYTGFFEDISTQYAILGIQIPFYQPKNYPRNILSIRFLNDQEGAYISRNRAYLGYSFHTKVFDNLFLGGAIELGSMGYVVEGTPSTGNASKYVLDSSAGISIYSENLTTGVSVNQAFNNEVQPLDEVSRLYRHVNVFASYNFIISQNADVYPKILFRYPYKSGYNYNLDIGLETILINKLLLGTSYRYKNGLSFNAGITNFEVLNGLLNFCLAYNTPLVGSVLNVNIFEIHISYRAFLKTPGSRLAKFKYPEFNIGKSEKLSVMK